ncbi:MAG: hypothetical protein P8X43_11930 [Maritimibacter sp.]
MPLLLSGCDSGVLWRDGVYSVYWIDTRENVFLGRRVHGSWIARVLPVVDAVASNELYIVARRRDDAEAPHEFRVLEKALDSDSAEAFESVSHALTADEFDDLRRRLNLPEPVPLRGA